MTATYDMVFEQGATWSRTFTWQDSDREPIPLTGYRAKLQVRARHSSDTPLLTLTSDPGGGIVVEPDGAIGEVYVRVPATASLSHGMYDLRLYDSDDSTEAVRLVQGRVFISPRVTR